MEFLNAVLSDPCTAETFWHIQRKYTDGYIQLRLFNEAEQETDLGAPEPEMEEIHPSSYKRKKRPGKKAEDLSAFETKKTPSLLKGSVATPSLEAGIMNVK